MSTAGVRGRYITARVRRIGLDTVHAERTPILTTLIPRDEIPATSRVDEAVRLDGAPRRHARVIVAVAWRHHYQYRRIERQTGIDFKLELVAIPVTDVDRAKAFYTDQVGFIAEHDHAVSDEIRFVQLTPPGSACSIALGTGI
jgi:hypothetical protein